MWNGNHRIHHMVPMEGLCMFWNGLWETPVSTTADVIGIRNENILDKDELREPYCKMCCRLKRQLKMDIQSSKIQGEIINFKTWTVQNSEKREKFFLSLLQWNQDHNKNSMHAIETICRQLKQYLSAKAWSWSMDFQVLHIRNTDMAISKPPTTKCQTISITIPLT